MRILIIIISLLFCSVVSTTVARAEFTHDPINTVDPALLIIDEDNFLGARLDGEMLLTDSEGKEFKLKSLYGKPIILVLSYFECDGACSTINKDLKKSLKDADGLVPGDDFRVLTVSFNKDDTLSDSKMFASMLALDEQMASAWSISTLKNPDEINALTDSVGYKYFWSHRDRVFIHPSVFIFLNPEGQVSRFLYGASLQGFNIEVAVAEAGFGRSARSNIKNLTNLLLTSCYSYNYKEGSYVLNYPLFIAVGSLLSSVSLVIFSIFFYKKRRGGKL